MPRIRFTVRHVMLVVLVVAVALAGFEAGRRWERGSAAMAAQNLALARLRAKQFAALRALEAAAVKDRKTATRQAVSTAKSAPVPDGNQRPEPSR